MTKRCCNSSGGCPVCMPDNFPTMPTVDLNEILKHTLYTVRDSEPCGDCLKKDRRIAELEHQRDLWESACSDWEETATEWHDRNVKMETRIAELEAENRMLKGEYTIDDVHTVYEASGKVVSDE